MANPGMTNCPASGFDPPGDPKASGSFGLLHEKVQRWVWQQGWMELHSIQEEAIRAILASTDDVIISAATAGGKTEAAFLPICSRLVGREPQGVDVLCVSPLKALINDQFSRLDHLCEHLEIPVHRWHGDVAQSRKRLLLKRPSGILLITPESLEAIFVIHGPKLLDLFGALSHVVVDELHAFIGSVRGRHLQSLLHRIELLIGRRIPRIGLSATLGDMSLAAAFLRPRMSAPIRFIKSDDDGQEIRLQLRGYCVKAPEPEHGDAPGLNGEKAPAAGDGGLQEICQHLFTTLRGTDNLVFANRRRDVEMCADILRRMCETNRVPNEFWPHHGSLSAELREEAESRLKDKSAPATVVCTNTLELGIDVGHVQNIAQIGPPPSVASMRQRLGRSGRRGNPAIMRIYVQEVEITAASSPVDRIRVDLVRAVALVRLLVEGWCEPPPAEALHFSTLVQQTLSLMAEKGGTTAVAAWDTLCESGPFNGVQRSMFTEFLRALADSNLIVQAPDGTLFPGKLGERIINHYSFFAAFQTPEEYRLVSGSRTLGSLPITYPVAEGSYIIFGGRRWKVVSVDAHGKVIDLQPTSAGRAPMFGGTGAWVHDRVREEMRRVYTDTEAPGFLDGQAFDLLAEGRENFRRMGFDRSSVIQDGKDAVVFCWAGDLAANTLMLQLWLRGFKVAREDLALTVENASTADIRRHLRQLAEAGRGNVQLLAAQVRNKEHEKYDHFLTQNLQALDYASRFLDGQGAWEVAARIAAEESLASSMQEA